MDKINIEGVILTPLKKITHPRGNILHAIKENDIGYAGFGEAYFSTINPGSIKGWNRHKQMTLNLIVPIGSVKFVIIDDRIVENNIVEIELSLQNYQRLTVPPGLWVGFQNMYKEPSLILNIADIEHDPDEKDTKSLDEIDYKWSNV